MIVIYGYLERESGKVFKFHMNKSSFFKISASLYKCDPLITLLLKASRLNTRRGGGVLIRGSTVFIYLKIKIRKRFVRHFDSTCMHRKCNVTITLKFITQFVYRNLMSSLPPFPVKVCQ